MLGIWQIEYQSGIWVQKNRVKAKLLNDQALKFGYDRPIMERIANFIWGGGSAEYIRILMRDIETEAIAGNDPYLFYRYFDLSCHVRGFDEKGEEYLRKSAEMGYLFAQTKFAALVDQPYWLQKAAEQGQEDSIWFLVLYLFDVQKRYVACQYWLKKTTKPKRAQKFMSKHFPLFEKIDSCRSSMITFLAIRKYRESVLSVIPKDVVVLIAKELWKTNQEECWDNWEVRKKIKV